MRTKQARTDEPVLRTPSTAAEWRERVGELEREAAIAERDLEERRGKRREAAGAALVFGADPADAAVLEAEERDAERRLDSLRCGVELARAELKKLEAAERQAWLDAQRARREGVADEIRQEADAVDGFFSQAAEHLRSIENLLARYQFEGGAFQRSLKGCTTRAALAAGLRQYLDTEYVGSSHHLCPLAEQLGALAVMRGAEDWPAAKPPAA